AAARWAMRHTPPAGWAGSASTPSGPTSNPAAPASPGWSAAAPPISRASKKRWTPSDLADHRRPAARRSAGDGAWRVARAPRWLLGVEDGPGLYRAAHRARCAGAAATLADAGNLAVPGAGRLGRRKRRSLGIPGEAVGRVL